MQLNEVLESKRFINSGGVSFKTPKELIEPFLEKVDKSNFSSNFTVKVSGKVENANEDETINASYGRILIEADFSDSLSNDITGGVVGFLYGLDTQRPIVKVYRGNRVFACTNLSVFNADSVSTYDILGNPDEAYQKTQQYLETLEENFAKQLELINALQSAQFSVPQIESKLGYMLKNVVTGNSAYKKLGVNPIIQGTKLLFGNSPYSIVEGKTNGWNLYNALTQVISDKSDLVDESQKSLIAYNLVNLN